MIYFFLYLGLFEMRFLNNHKSATREHNNDILATLIHYDTAKATQNNAL